MTPKNTPSPKAAALPEKINGAAIGARLKALREMYGLSQRELARRTGITNGMISLMEQNQASPSVASLKKVLDGFPVSLAEFFTFDPAAEARIFYKADDLMEIATGRIAIRQVGRKRPDRRLQLLRRTFAPGSDTGKKLLSHEGEEAGIVISGEIEITVGGKTRLLQPGDAWYFSIRLPHRLRNIGKVPCEIISACTPPAI